MRHQSPKEICEILEKRSLLRSEQCKEILSRFERYREELIKRRKQRGRSEDVDAIDVITAFRLQRPGGRLLDEETLYETLAEEWKVPYRKIDPLQLDLHLVTNTIPKHFARRHQVLPIAVEDGVLLVATPNPFNSEALDDIARVAQRHVQAVVTPKTDVLRLIAEFFGFQKSIAAAEMQFGGPRVDLGNLEQLVELTSAEDVSVHDSHIVNAVNHLFSYAFDQRASDIHIEPKRENSVVRMRIDGILHTIYRLPKQVHNAIVSRIKTLSRLDMAEKRRPQDGRIKTEKRGKEVEIRVSTLPVAFGEKVVMRLMDPDILFQDLATLGFSGRNLDLFSDFIHQPHGILLVCGPTGSGKSTTLYSALQTLSTPAVNITTIEDPIEMVHDDFNQIAVHPAIDLTFATALRHILRQDPDVIMIGEMRDLETAKHAVQAALTGHLVLSTLHTNDAPSSIIRLMELGVEPYLVQATLVGIVSQRLVRRICDHCKESYTESGAILRGQGLLVDGKAQVSLWRGAGCPHCRGTGYRGRTAIFEILSVTDAMRSVMQKGVDIPMLRQQAMADGMQPLRENAMEKLLAGTTTVEEVLRVTMGQVAGS